MSDSRSATLSEVVADALRQALCDAVYMPGERLIELTIAHEMNVSQNTVRDALRLLEQEGWLIKRARHGVTVREFTWEETDELCALRAAVEGLVFGWALERLTPADLLSLRRIIAEGRAHADAHHLPGAREAVFSFHAALGRIAARQQTAALLNRLHNQLRLLENIRQAHLPRDRKQWRGLLVEYAALVDLIAAADHTAAQAAFSRLLISERRSLLAVLELL